MEKEEEKIIPINDYVLVDFQPFIDRQTKSGIYVGKPKFEGVPNRGKVYAVAKNITDVKVGDFIIYNSEKGRGIKYKDLKLIPVKIDEICGVINESI